MKKLCSLIYFRGIEVGTRANQSYPLSLMTISEFAKADAQISNYFNFEIDIYDYFDSDEAILLSLSKSKPSVLGFSCYLWNITRTMQLIRKIKCVLDDILIIVGGPEVFDSKYILEKNPMVDIVVAGEGEIAFRQILLNVKNQKDFFTIPQISYRINGEIKLNTLQNAIVEDLDLIPTIVNDPLISKYNSAILETARGCPFNCKYCLWMSSKVRFYSLERVKSDITSLLSNPHINNLFIIDSEIDINIERAKEILRHIALFNTRKISVNIFLGLHKLDEEFIQLIRDANVLFGIGIQSTDTETCRIIGRNWFSSEKMLEKLDMFKKYFHPQKIELQLIMGLPGDNYEKFRKSVMWCLTTGYRVTANRLYLLPGSYLYSHATDYGIKFDPEPFHLVYSNNTYSFTDIVRSEAFWRAVGIFNEYFPHTYWWVLKKFNLEVADLIDQLESMLLDYSLCFNKRQENDASNNKVSEEHLKKIFRKIIAGVINIAHLESDLFDWVLSQKIHNQALAYFADVIRKHQMRNDKNNFLIDGYFIAPYIQIAHASDLVFCREERFLLLLDIHKNTLKKIKVKKDKIKIIKALLKQLEKTKTLAEIDEWIKKNLFADEKKYICNLVEYLKTQNVIWNL